MPDLDLAELERLAKAATAGPVEQWAKWRGRDGTWCVSLVYRNIEGLRTTTYIPINSGALADFIAALNPAVVLALLARLKAAEADRDKLARDLTWMRDYQNRRLANEGERECGSE